jgi:hypothetical protein
MDRSAENPEDPIMTTYSSCSTNLIANQIADAGDNLRVSLESYWNAHLWLNSISTTMTLLKLEQSGKLVLKE